MSNKNATPVVPVNVVEKVGDLESSIVAELLNDRRNYVKNVMTERFKEIERAQANVARMKKQYDEFAAMTIDEAYEVL